MTIIECLAVVLVCVIYYAVRAKLDDLRYPREFPRYRRKFLRK